MIRITIADPEFQEWNFKKPYDWPQWEFMICWFRVTEQEPANDQETDE